MTWYSGQHVINCQPRFKFLSSDYSQQQFSQIRVKTRAMALNIPIVLLPAPLPIRSPTVPRETTHGCIIKGCIIGTGVTLFPAAYYISMLQVSLTRQRRSQSVRQSCSQGKFRRSRVRLAHLQQTLTNCRQADLFSVRGNASCLIGHQGQMQVIYTVVHRNV